MSRSDRDGYTALRNACDQGHKHIAAMLEKATPAGDIRPSQEELEETSTNFDLDDVKPFLNQVAERLEGGFTADTASDLGSEIENMAHDHERTWMFRVVYEGAEMPLRIGVFRDDISAADLYFYEPPRLVAMIEELFDREADEDSGIAR